MKHSRLRDELLAMLEEDQREVRAQSKRLKRAPKAASTVAGRNRLTIRCQERAGRMMEILEEIDEPTIENVGADGSQALSVLALHSRLSIMKEVLQAFEKSYEKDPNSVYHESIPSLADRILIFERKNKASVHNGCLEQTANSSYLQLKILKI